MSRREDIDNAIWSDPDFIALSADGRYLYLWSFTNPRCGMAGLYKLSLAPIPAETGLTMRRITDALEELSGAAFAFYEDGVIWVRTRVAHLRSRNPNIGKSIAADVGKLREDHPLRVRFLSTYRHLSWLEEHLSCFPLVEPKSETVAKRSADRLPTVQGLGKGTSSSPAVVEVPRDAEWKQWLTHYRETTGRVGNAQYPEARKFFNARRAEGVSVEELLLATVGCHGDDYLREHKLDRPQTILRVSNFRRYIELAQSRSSAKSSGHGYLVEAA